MSLGRILHTPTVVAYLSGDQDVQRMVAAAVRQAVPLLVPSLVISVACAELADLYRESLVRRVRLLTTSPAVVVGHLLAGQDAERAMATGHLAHVLGLQLQDAHTLDEALSRMWPIMTTRAAAGVFSKVEPWPAIDFI